MPQEFAVLWSLLLSAFRTSFLQSIAHFGEFAGSGYGEFDFTIVRTGQLAIPRVVAIYIHLSCPYLYRTGEFVVAALSGDDGLYVVFPYGEIELLLLFSTGHSLSQGFYTA